MSDHLAAVQAIYEAFGRADIPAILERLAPDVAWEQWDDNYAQRAGVAHMKQRSDRDGVAEFFGEVGNLGLRSFEVLDILAGERQVAAEIRFEAERFADEEIHLWTFGDDGLVTRFRHYVDTAKHIEGTR
jgi:ketosteroid isomerase-like protein